MQYSFYLLPVVLSVVGLAGLYWGWPRAHTYRSPERYRTGLVLVAAGLIDLWLLPLGLYMILSTVDTELQGLLYLLALFCAAGPLGGGLDMISRANKKPLGSRRSQKAQ
jgi:hypothetical protein